jgi:hypothetical protein
MANHKLSIDNTQDDC